MLSTIKGSDIKKKKTTNKLMWYLPRKREKKTSNAKTISVLTTANKVLNVSFQTEIYKTIKIQIIYFTS